MSVLDVLASTHSNLFIVRHFYFIDFAQYGCNVTYINQVIIRQIIKIAFNPPSKSQKKFPKTLAR